MDQGVARKAQPEPEGEMEKTKTPADPEASLYLILYFSAGVSKFFCSRKSSKLRFGHIDDAVATMAYATMCPIC